VDDNGNELYHFCFSVLASAIVSILSLHEKRQLNPIVFLPENRKSSEPIFENLVHCFTVFVIKFL